MRCAWSLAASANPHHFDVHLYVDDDDAATRAITASLSGIVDLHCTFGPRMTGTYSVGTYAVMANALAAKSAGAWKWLFTDDAMIEGKGWDAVLSMVPATGYIAYGDQHKLASPPHNATVLVAGEAWTHPIVPAECFPFPLNVPPDNWAREEWIGRRGWSKHLLPRITVNHQNVDPFWK